MNSTPVSRRICACGRYFYIQKKKAEEFFIKKQIHIRQKLDLRVFFLQKKFIYRGFAVCYIIIANRKLSKCKKMVILHHVEEGCRRK